MTTRSHLGLLELAQLLAEAFLERGIAAQAVSGATPKDERRAILGRSD